MAIIVKNINITPRSTEPVVDRSYEVSIDKFGNVNVGESGVLDLGCQGDHNITKLEFNVENLNCAKTLKNYIPVLVFSGTDKNGDLTNISCTGVNNDTSKTSTFYIPEDVTTMSKDYSIVYTLREINESSGNIGEVTNNTDKGDIDEKEVFVSNEFKGKVRTSIYADLVEVIKVKQNGTEMKFSTDLLPKLVGKRTEPIKTTEGIYKKKIELTWPDGKDGILINKTKQDSLSDEDKVLGNKYDVFMTYITIDHPFYHEQSEENKEDNEIFVIFISNDKDGNDYAVITTATTTITDTGEKLAAVWVPAEVTISDKEKWKVGFVGLKEDKASTNGY